MAAQSFNLMDYDSSLKTSRFVCTLHIFSKATVKLCITKVRGLEPRLVNYMCIETRVD